MAKRLLLWRNEVDPLCYHIGTQCDGEYPQERLTFNRDDLWELFDEETANAIKSCPLTSCRTVGAEGAEIKLSLKLA